MTDTKKILAAICIVIALSLAAMTLIPAKSEKTGTPGQNASFSILEFGRAGSSAYIVYSASGTGSIRMLSLSEPAKNEIYVLDQKGIENERFQELAGEIKSLKDYNLSVHIVGPAADVKNGIYIIPTGAMPIYVLDKIKSGENVTFVYLGETDLVIRTTTKKEEWYAGLKDEERKKIIVENTTTDKMLEKGETGKFLQEILENGWAGESRKEVDINGTGRGTQVMQTGNGRFFRVVVSLDGYNGAHDFELPKQSGEITVSNEVYPWEGASAEVSVNKTNGTAYFNVEKDGQLVKSEKLERVSEETFFRMDLKFHEPGDYVLKVVDNGGTIATGLLHVKKLGVKLKELKGTYYYTFSVEVDGKPLKEGNANVSIKNSTSPAQEFAITGGSVTVPAKLAKGNGTFVFELLGGKAEVPVETPQENIFDVYVRYGPWGLLLIIAVYLLARANRKQAYTIRIVEIAPEIRKELKITSKIAQQIFKSARKDLKIEGPLRAHEFAVGLKRHVTEGADVTEGNVEELLKKMGKLGLVLSWKGYYQLSEDGNIKRNVMKRIIREKLIERGINFRINEEKFMTRDFDIGFFDGKFRKKAVIVFEDGDELKRELMELDERERSRLFLKEFNGVINLIPIDKLDDVL